MLMQIIEDGRAPFRVFMRGDKSARLVKEEQARALTLGERLAIDADLIVWPDVERRARQDRAIDGDPPLRDPGLRVAARAKSGAGDNLGDSIRLRGRGVLVRPWAVSAGPGFRL
jgi:hypothetical protein